MSRLVWMVAGLLGGIIVGRNAEPMVNPAGGAVVLALLVGCGVCWMAAYRGKSQAVATAVAVATASVHAEVEATAQAIAQAALHIHLGNSAPNLAHDAETMAVDPGTLLAHPQAVPVYDAAPVPSLMSAPVGQQRQP